jgi:hypothetical protein
LLSHAEISVFGADGLVSLSPLVHSAEVDFVGSKNVVMAFLCFSMCSCFFSASSSLRHWIETSYALPMGKKLI